MKNPTISPLKFPPDNTFSCYGNIRGLSVAALISLISNYLFESKQYLSTPCT